MATILVVDDDSETTELFTRALSHHGYDVVAASSAGEAIWESSRVQPDAMLIDLRLPVIDGATLLESLGSLNGLGDVPAAIVTGDYFVTEDDLARLHALGAEVKFKPLWMDDLDAIVQGLLKKRSHLGPGHGSGQALSV